MSANDFSVLELRRLLSVSVVGSQNGVLKLVGDGGSDTVDIEGNGSGQVEVFVNGISQGTFSNVVNINATLGAGNDVLNLSGIDISGNVVANLGAGNDTFHIDNTTLLGAGADANVHIGGNVNVKLGGDAGDLVDIQSSVGSGLGVDIDGNVALIGAADIDIDGDGADSTVEAADVQIGGNLAIKTRLAGDANLDGRTLVLDNVNVSGKTSVKTGASSDNVLVAGSRLGGKVAVNLGAGADILDVDSLNDDTLSVASMFQSSVKVSGGADVDTLDELSTNVFLAASTATKFESFVNV